MEQSRLPKVFLTYIFYFSGEWRWKAVWFLYSFFFFNSKLFLGAFSRENIFPLSAALHLEVGPCEISPKCVSTGNVVTQVIVSQSYCWSFIVAASLSCLDDTILWQMCWASGSYDLSTPSSWCFLNLKHLACVVGWFLSLVLCILTSCGPLE